MKHRFGILTAAAASAAALAVASFAATQAVQAQSMRTVDGQTYWRGDPGPIDPGSFWDGGQNKYDRHHYSGSYTTSPGMFTDVVYASHSGSARCVWRQRVVNSNWEFHHPYLQVCRP
ncbi:hypothetical protein QM467_11135 [Rhodoblastus sp. 17X3]|uniref:hypothetical protein n=1 Tax=Rhodoblastus sp. 17X3 TaxID=3047026 RepID=UPI0024B71BA0|nr:hypothetical protein [Rhodoblastus sp. 17X3]MDI9848608.1 hypothetical protein [Rhodoblastus sp. 17X3]